MSSQPSLSTSPKSTFIPFLVSSPNASSVILRKLPSPLFRNSWSVPKSLAQ
ncbi:hypothetical protein THIOM_000976 [Candidatus Thiomargarita nelsonii]|uniref:Uncharacterized protein n=1 Tax=Candidatus Thiomargarita nelsonii TaxID=1003181 RepID=A0A176S5B6_9GAMM|nr:hypothetical protein THIOM_000976 [Candidatus Thiomargarita nelsonii]